MPASLYSRVIPRVTVPVSTRASSIDPFAEFVLRRCSPAFLRGWATVHDQDLDRLLRFGGYIDAHWEPQVLGRLQEAGALPETLRRKAVEQLVELAFDLLDAGWLDEPVCQLFTNVEREELLGRIRDEILPNLDEEIDRSADGYLSDVEPEHRYQAASDAIAAYKLAFASYSEIVTRLDEAERYVAQAIEAAASDYESQPSAARLAEPSISRLTTLHDRDEFDDIAEGR